MEPDEAPDSVIDPARKRRKTAGFLGGDSASSVEGVPFFLPAAVLGGVGAGVAGWKGVDALLESRRKRFTT